VSLFGARTAPEESCPAGLLAIAGLRWWRRRSPSQPKGGFREIDQYPTAAAGSRFATRRRCPETAVTSDRGEAGKVVAKLLADLTSLVPKPWKLKDYSDGCTEAALQTRFRAQAGDEARTLRPRRRS